MSLFTPAEIDVSVLPSVDIKDVNRLPKESGVYFVFTQNPNNIVYIGQSSCLYARLRGHPKRKVFSDLYHSRVAWLLVPYEMLSSLEISLIDRFKPSLNAAKGGGRRPVTDAVSYRATTLRVPPEIYDMLRTEAQKIGRPLNTHVVRILEGHCAKVGKKPRKAVAL